MTYPIDMINIFINKITTQKCTLKKCADDLLISYAKYTFKHKFNNKRISVLMAIDSQGIIQYELINGSVNSNIFIKFLECFFYNIHELYKLHY